MEDSHILSVLWVSFLALWARTEGFFWHSFYLHSSAHFLTGWEIKKKNGRIYSRRIKNSKLMLVQWHCNSVILLPATFCCFISESSNRSFMHSKFFLSMYSVEVTGWSVFTPSYLELEISSMISNVRMFPMSVIRNWILLSRIWTER